MRHLAIVPVALLSLATPAFAQRPATIVVKPTPLSGLEPRVDVDTVVVTGGVGKHDIKMLATDIDTDILARAEAGIYPAELFERLPADVKPMLKLEGGVGRGDARISEHFLVIDEGNGIGVIGQAVKLSLVCHVAE